MTQTREEFDAKVALYDRAIQELYDNDPQFQTLRPYVQMYAATKRYAELALKDAIWQFAQVYVDVASAVPWDPEGTSHTEIPAEFSTLFDDAYTQILNVNPPNAGDEIQQIYDIMMATMRDAITFGIFIRPEIGSSGAVAEAFIKAQDTLFRQTAEVIYEVKKAYRRLGPIGLAIEGAKISTGLDGEPPESAYQLFFYTKDDKGKERQPVWVEIHAALIGSEVTVDLAKRTGAEFRDEVEKAAGVDTAKDIANLLTDVMDLVGGAAGLLIGAAAIAAGIYLFKTLRK